MISFDAYLVAYSYFLPALVFGFVCCCWGPLPAYYVDIILIFCFVVTCFTLFTNRRSSKSFYWIEWVPFVGWKRTPMNKNEANIGEINLSILTGSNPDRLWQAKAGLRGRWEAWPCGLDPREVARDAGWHPQARRKWKLPRLQARNFGPQW